ncbi:MAG: hypothetical protein KGI10_09395 [Thaumarchaeota archaeon]|nr:hypothetical protein [Nitrososphaerota archaeon]
MLLEDKTKAVEYFVENVLAGTLNVEIMKLANMMGKQHIKDEDLDSLQPFVNQYLKWIELRKTNSSSKEFINLTDDLFTVLARGRLFGFITGVFKEISLLENELADCKSDNIQLTSLLKEQGRIIASYEAGMHTKK